MPSLPSYSEADLTRLWNESLDPSGVGLAQAIAMDIASYTGEPIDVVTARMASGATEFKAQWEQAQVDPTDPASVAAFYRTQVVEAYELAHWHAGLTTGEVPLNYARTATLAREVGAARVLDFGCGIGSGSIVLAGTGAEVHSADIAKNLLDLTGHRLTRHGHTPHLIDLTAAEKPRTNYYDLISCFDVLEHIPDQLATVKELETYLGGRAAGLQLLQRLERPGQADAHLVGRQLDAADPHDRPQPGLGCHLARVRARPETPPARPPQEPCGAGSPWRVGGPDPGTGARASRPASSRAA